MCFKINFIFLKNLANMICIFLALFRSEIIQQCEMPDTNDFVITNYFRDKCGPCDRVTHFMDEIDSRLERNGAGLQIRYVNCTKCDCSEFNVDRVPTITVTENKKVKDSIQGFREFGELVEFLAKNTGIDRRIFRKRIKSTPGKVVALKDRDFLTAFDGPWLILFYDTKSDMKRELIEQIAEEYEAHLNVGEIDGRSVPSLLEKYSIPVLPALLAFYNGLLVGFNGEDTIEKMREFVDELIRPSFETMDFAKFTEMEKNMKPGDPIFIVFYKDLSSANDYFQSIAHEYKFRAKIYKSDDPLLIKKANVDLEKNDLILTVYRNKTFHQNEHDLANKDTIFNWIFHAHYPNLTKITNESIYMILHGIKPVVLLLSRDDDFVEEFEKISADVHRGVPFVDKIFASLDIAEYSLFVPKMLPDMVVPTVVILDPTSSKFYAEKKRIHRKNITEYTNKLIENYNAGKLKEYPYKKNWITPIVVMLIIVFLGGFVAKSIVKRRIKVTQYC
ncbi:hypothetical protein EDEG_00730 [Edhazardia aedis USNM 41457]|uniref:Thioredoxin domain-containing protein n=1 Tax=Edhazardia aedis (strain USNM 41457) TaxID=1003232 RepID=J8ZZX7_EDHAE|nr:hypothetical protein EDEG_00730 [Edhazardia aedis USNM 41457]|eukprot:EJW05198.1 hypothetical protein EDEG_00730 [Edhazardia aedis USNM 41457]